MGHLGSGRGSGRIQEEVGSERPGGQGSKKGLGWEGVRVQEGGWGLEGVGT